MPTGIGYDIATTEKNLSNPSALVVMQHLTPQFVGALYLRWKTADPDIAIAVVNTIVDDILDTGTRPRRLCIDATNEKYHASRVKKHLLGKVPVDLIAGSQNIDYLGVTYSAKVLLGNLYCAIFEDNQLAMPPVAWLRDDHRLVKRDRGSFTAEVSGDGSHADTFDAGKLALWAVNKSGGRAQAEAAPVGGLAATQTIGRRLLNPFAHLFGRGQHSLNT